MPTIVAVTDLAELINLRAVFTLSCPLPRVFSAVSKENICSSGVEATLVNGSLVRLRISLHIEVKDVFAVIPEVLLVHSWTSHGSLLRHGLEPAILSAVLESPWSTCIVGVDLVRSNDASVVVSRVITILIAVIDQFLCNSLIIFAINWLHVVA